MGVLEDKIDREKVQVWIYSAGGGQSDQPPRVLLLLTRPDRGGVWQPVTGGVESGELIEEAALREAQEETGFRFSDPPQPLGRSFKFKKGDQIFRETGFSLSVQGEPKPEIDLREHVDFAWVNLDSAFRLLGHRSNQEMLEALVSLHWKSFPQEMG